MLTAAEYRENLRQATLAERLEQAGGVTNARLDADVEHGALTEAQRRQVQARRAELRDGDEDGDFA